MLKILVAAAIACLSVSMAQATHFATYTVVGAGEAHYGLQAYAVNAVFTVGVDLDPSAPSNYDYYSDDDFFYSSANGDQSLALYFGPYIYASKSVYYPKSLYWKLQAAVDSGSFFAIYDQYGPAEYQASGQIISTTVKDDTELRPFGMSLTRSVPEPASWALMLTGFGAIGGAMRTRRRAIAA